MINEETLRLVKPGAWLINVARGRLVDERALLRALHDGPLGGAVLDTFRDEPLPPMSSFYDLPNVIVTPHTAWSSGRVLDRSIELFCDNLGRFARGETLLNVVDPARGTDRADRDRRPRRVGQDHGLQHVDARSRRDRRLRRDHHERRQGPRRATRPAGRDLQAEEDRPRRRDLWTCPHRRPRPRATSAPRSCRPSTSRGYGTPMPCCTWSARSRTRPTRIPKGASIPGATSSGSISSSCWPTSR